MSCKARHTLLQLTLQLPACFSCSCAALAENTPYFTTLYLTSHTAQILTLTVRHYSIQCHLLAHQETLTPIPNIRRLVISTGLKSAARASLSTQETFPGAMRSSINYLLCEVSLQTLQHKLCSSTKILKTGSWVWKPRMIAHTYNPSIQERWGNNSRPEWATWADLASKKLKLWKIWENYGLREQTLSQKNQSCERFEKIKKLKEKREKGNNWDCTRQRRFSDSIKRALLNWILENTLVEKQMAFREYRKIRWWRQC